MRGVRRVRGVRGGAEVFDHGRIPPLVVTVTGFP
ncbi:hypothetical protein SZN_16260 [Streptomyces zinciresistens K42]|uniref:Uncharacterized protein n=1 Tax=Streptomyces zinciresistens K42 TaxID=700597 RepID=G2GCL6_9ACTN|nr:hypothetical protein SZN_16260 [Streptomyces zinciresistens K42]